MTYEGGGVRGMTWSVPVFLRKPIATCDFPGGGGSLPLHLSGPAHTVCSSAMTNMHHYIKTGHVCCDVENLGICQIFRHLQCD